MKPILMNRLVFPAFYSLLILALPFLFTQCNSGPKNYIEDYFPLVYKGDLAFFKKDYVGSYTTLKEAIDLLEPTNFEPYRELEKLANLAARLNKPEIAFNTIKKLIEQGYPMAPFEQDTVYSPLWKLPAWKEIVEEYPKQRKAYLQSINADLRNEIRKMNERDQKYRSRADRQRYRTEQLQLDSFNVVRLKEIFETWGFPGQDLIGYIPLDSAEQLSVLNILMRTPGDIRQEYFIPKMKSFVEEGKCPPNDLGLLIDQYHLSREGYQLYGTMAGPKGLFPIKDQRRLDERRLAIGLPTLRMEAQRDSVIRMSFYLKRLAD